MAGLNFDITGDNSNFLRKLDEARNGIRSTSKQIEESGTSIEQMFGRMAKGAAALGAGFSAQQFASQVLKVRGEFQQLEVAFNTMLGSEEKANTLMQQLVRTAATTPFDLQSVAGGAKQLLAYGTAADDVNGTLVRLGDIAAGLSIPLGDLVYLYGTTMAQGRLYTQDFNQFTSRGIPMISELAKQFGVAESEVKKLVESGKVGFPEVQKVIQSLTNEGGKFGGLMEAQSKTITGQISNIEDSISTMYNNIGKSSEGFINDALSGVSYLVANYEAVGKTILELAVTYGAYKAVLMSVAAYQSFAVGVTYTAEIAELSKLIPLKQQSANEDIVAAVASGKLTQSKAAQVIALRAEISAKIQSLQATEAQTKAEYASVMASYKNATQRMLLAKQNMAIAQSQMSIAIKSGTIEEIAAAKKNAQTASLELNNAAVAKNTAHKSVNIAATNSKSASEVLNTVQTGLNTVSQNTNTVSTNILTAAKTKLAAASKALGLSMLANPYVLATAAIVGLGYGIYKLITHQTDAEKAQLKLNDAVKECEKNSLSEQRELAKLKGELSTLTKGTDEYNATKEKIVKNFGKYHENLGSEIEKVGLTEQAYNKLTEAINRSFGARQYEKFASKQQDELSDTMAENLENIQERLLSELGNEYGSKIYAKIRNGVMRGSLSLGKGAFDIKGLDSETKTALDKAAGKDGGIFDITNRSIEGYIQNIILANKATDDLDKKAKERFGIDDNPVNAEGKGNDNAAKAEQKAASEWLSSYKKAYEDADIAYNDFLKSKQVMSEADRDKELKRLKELRDTAKTTYEAKGGSASSDNKQESAADKLRKEQEKLTLLMDKQALDQSRSSEDLQTQVDQARINAMREGSVRTLEQMKLDHSKEMQQLDRQQEDLLRKKIEEERAKFDAKEDENAAKDPKHVKQTFDGSKVTLSQSEKDAFGNQKMYLSIQQAGETQALLDKERQSWNEYLSEYGTFQEKKEAITAEYNEKISNAATKGEKASLKKELEGKQKDLNLDELKSSINFADIFGNLDAQSTEALTVMRNKLKEVINESAQDLKPTDLKALQDAFKDIDIKVSERNPFGELKHGADDYRNATQSVIKAQEDLNTVQQGGAVITGTYIDATGKICTKLLTQEQAEKNLSDAQRKRLEAQSKLNKSVNSIGENGQQLVKAGSDLTNMLTDLGISIPDSVKGALDGVGQVMDSMASIDLMKPMSILTGITGMLAGIGKTIGSIFGGSSNGTKVYEDMKEQLSAINEIYEKIIANSKEEIVFGGGFSSIQAANDALDTYYKKIQNYRKIAAAGGEAGASKGSHSYAYRANKRLSGDWGSISNVIGQNISSVQEMYNLTGEQLYLIQTKFPEAWRKIPSEISDSLSAIIECKDEAGELAEALNSAMTGIDTDSFYSGFIDSLSDMDTSFEDMCDNFEGYLRKSIIAGLVASQYQGRIDSLYKKWSDAAVSDKKITEEESNALQDEYKKIVEEMMKDREDMANSFGWTSGESTSQNSTKGGFETMSQDTGTELNGRFTALQISNEEIKNSMLAMLTGVNLISTTTIANGITLMEIRNLAISSNSHLEDIARFTKPLLEVGGKLDRIESNTKGLTKR